MMKRSVWNLALMITLLVLAGTAAAQNTTTFGNITTLGTPCGSANCVYYQLPPATPWVVVTVTGTWSGTLETAITSAPNANYSNLDTVAWTVLSTSTANGTWSPSTSGATYLRVRASLWTSGLAHVVMTAAQSQAVLLNPVFPGVVTAAGFQAPSGGTTSNCWATNGTSVPCSSGTSYPGVTADGANGLNVAGKVTPLNGIDVSHGATPHLLQTGDAAAASPTYITGAVQAQNLFTLRATRNAIANMQTGSGNSPTQLRVLNNGDSTTEWHNLEVACMLTAQYDSVGFDFGGLAGGQTAYGQPCASGLSQTNNAASGTITTNNGAGSITPGSGAPYDFTRAPDGVVTNLASGASITYGTSGSYAFGNTLRVYYLAEPTDGIYGATPGTITITATSPAGGTCASPCTLYTGSASNASAVGMVKTFTEPLDFYTITISASGGAVDIESIGIFDTSHNGIIAAGGTGRGGLSLPDSTTTPAAVYAPWFAAAAGSPVQITAYSCTSTLCVFTANNSFAAGQQVILSGFAVANFFNGQNVAVSGTGLSSTQFQATVGTATTSSGAENGYALASDSNALVMFEMKANGGTGGTGGCQQNSWNAPGTYHDYSYWLGQYASQWLGANPLADLEFTSTYDANFNGTTPDCFPVFAEQQREVSQANGYFWFDNFFQATAQQMRNFGWLSNSVHTSASEQIANSMTLWKAMGLEGSMYGVSPKPVATTNVSTQNLFFAAGPSPRTPALGICNPASTSCAMGSASAQFKIDASGNINQGFKNQVNVWNYNFTTPYFCIQTYLGSAPAGCFISVNQSGQLQWQNGSTANSFINLGGGGTGFGNLNVWSTRNDSSGQAVVSTRSGNASAFSGALAGVTNTDYWRWGMSSQLTGGNDYLIRDEAGSKVIVDIPSNTVPRNSLTFDSAGAILGVAAKANGNINLTPVATPTQNATTTATTGGTLAASTQYCYRLSATNVNGETLAAAEHCVTTGSGTSTNTAQINWSLDTGATGYKIYGRTTGAELLLASVGANVVQYTDTGSGTPSGALPASNTTLGNYQINGAQIAAANLSDGNTGTGALVHAASPALSGTPTGPTAAASDNSTTLATTAYVRSRVLVAALVTTAAASDNVTLTGMTSTGTCALTATNAAAATNIATTYISAKTTNQITVTHTATASMNYDVVCTP